MLQTVDSEVGRLRSVLVHRPGPELARLRDDADLLFPGLPWVARAQEEHDRFTALLRAHGVEVLYLADLLAEVLAVGQARAELVDTLLADPRLGTALHRRLAGYLSYLDDAGLAGTLLGGLTQAELRTGDGLVYTLLDPAARVVQPLPNAVLVRDTAAVVADRVAVASLTGPARYRESTLIDTVLRWHPRFLGTPLLHRPGQEPLAGGDVLLPGPGVVAIGVGGFTTAAAAERLSREVLASGAAHTVLVAPLPSRGGRTHLDALCTFVDVDLVVTPGRAAEELVAYQLTAGPDGEPEIRAPRPLLTVAAQALGLDRLRVLETALDPVPGGRGQWDNAGNVLALAPGTCLAFERSAQTNAELERAGVEVLTGPAGELRSRRGGPRSLCCPLSRDPLR